MDTVSQEEFRAAIESRFNFELTDGQFDAFLDRVPLDEEGNVQYARFMQQFDTKWAPLILISNVNWHTTMVTCILGLSNISLGLYLDGWPY